LLTYPIYISDIPFNDTLAGHLENDLTYVKLDIIAVTDDLTDVADQVSLGKAHTYLRKLCTKLGLDPLTRLFVVPGNHDVNNLWGRLSVKWKLNNFEKFESFTSAQRKARYLKEFDTVFFSFDSTITELNIAEGQISPQEIVDFDRDCMQLVEDQSPVF
jgi:hypothetical protein